MALEPARRGGADWFPETIRQSVPRPSKRQDRVLIGHSLESKSQEWSVTGCYLDVKVSVFQIHRQKPVLRAYLHEDLFQIQHSERLSHEGRIQMSKIENWSEPADLYWERGSIGCRSLTRCSLRRPFTQQPLQAVFALRNTCFIVLHRSLHNTSEHRRHCERNGARSLILWFLEPNLTHRGWLSNQQPGGKRLYFYWWQFAVRRGRTDICDCRERRNAL